MLLSNSNTRELQSYLQSNQYDLISIQECTPNLLKKLNSYTSYTLTAEVRNDPFGICLFSKEGDFNVKHFTKEDIPSIVGDAYGIKFVFTHPPPPITTKLFYQRNQHYENISAHFKKAPNLMIVGDLNSSPWNRSFQQFLKNQHLKILGSQWNGSWPAFSPWRIMLDYCLIGPQIRGIDFEILKNNGSDHLPIHCSVQKK